ncbi:MAG TPA: hypothetical protein VIO38_04980, partial [Rariglobus sp.]
GPKATTTIAFTRAEAARHHPLSPPLLGDAFMGRWRRSDSRFPKTLPEADRPAFAATIESHPQFAK